MQPDQIVLPVDLLNDGSTSNQTYKRFTPGDNRTVYIGENHVPESRDTLTLYRSFSKKSGNFMGVQKTSVKFSHDVSVPGVDSESTVVAPIIVEVSFSMPVGVTDAQMIIERQRAIALLDLDAVMTPLNIQAMV